MKFRCCFEKCKYKNESIINVFKHMEVEHKLVVGKDIFSTKSELCSKCGYEKYFGLHKEKFCFHFYILIDGKWVKVDLRKGKEYVETKVNSYNKLSKRQIKKFVEIYGFDDHPIWNPLCAKYELIGTKSERFPKKFQQDTQDALKEEEK